MPLRPPWLDRLQFIMFYAFNPCDAEASLYLEMAKEPVGNLALLLVEPDLSQIVQNLFTPKGLRSKRHGRKGNKDGKNKKGGFPSVDDIVADRIGEGSELPHRKYGMGQRFFFTGMQVADRITWPMVLIDEVTNTAFDTFSGVMLEKKEQCDQIARMYRKGGGYIVQELSGWAALAAGPLDYIVGMNSSFDNNCFVFDGVFSVTVAITWSNPTFSDKQVQCRIVRPGQEPAVEDETSPRTVQPGGTVQTISSARCKGPGVIAWERRSLGGTTVIDKVEVMVLQIGGGLFG